MNKLTKKGLLLITALTFAMLCAGLALAKPSAGGYELFGDAALVSPGNGSPTAAQLSSDSDDPFYGGIDFAVTSGLTLADLDKLSADYKSIAGGCGGGSPRFQVNVLDPNTNTVKNIFVYFEPCSATPGWNSTGNLLDPADTVDTSQIGGTFYQPYAAAQAAYGSYEIVGIQLVVDSSWAVGGTQTFHVDNVMINNKTITFESADSCKNGGWQQYSGAPGPFKNQGQCVSYYAKGGQ